MATKKVVKDPVEVNDESIVAAIESLNDSGLLVGEGEEIVLMEGKGKKATQRDIEDLTQEFKDFVEPLVDDENLPDDVKEMYEAIIAAEAEGGEKEPVALEEVTEDTLVEAVEGLNESGKLADEVVIYEGKGKSKTVRDFAELSNDFMTALETLTDEEIEELEQSVCNVYNFLSNKAKEAEEAARASKKGKKTEKKVDKKIEKTDKEKDPEKVARGKALAASRKENKGPGNLVVMEQLLKEKKTDKEILKVFTKRYEGKEVDFIQKRIAIYKKLAEA